MRTVILGETTTYNQHIIDEIKAGYNPAFIRSVKGFRELESMNLLPPPIMGHKYLLILDYETNTTGANQLLEKIERLPQNDYVDVLLRLFVKGSTELITSCKMINLNRTRYTDLQDFIARDLDIEPAMAKIIVRKIGINLSIYELYRYELESEKPLTETKINKIIKYKKNQSLHQILYGILIRENKAYRDFRKSLYPEPWLSEYFVKELNKIIKLKIQVRNREKDMYEIRKNDSTRKYYDLVLNIPITECAMLRNILLENKVGGIDRYYLTNSIDKYILRKEN